MKSQSSIGRVYGWKRGLPIFNDHHLTLGAPVALPRSVNNYSSMPPVWDQGAQGSCTAHGNGAADCFARKRLGLPFVMPSRSFIYYNERVEEGTVNQDSGASVSEGIDVMQRYGVPPEDMCPYDGHKLMTTKPSDAVYAEALKHRAVNAGYLSQDLYTIQQALAQNYAIVFGFTVYQNFESDAVAKTGLVPMPQGRPIGGHCVIMCGFNSHNYAMCRNSWGTGWGDPDFPGYFWMPPAYYTNPQLAADFRVVQTVQN
jgi:C1A family cysteine protease